jgi:hypothetical protein
VTANTTYIGRYFAPNGNYAQDVAELVMGLLQLLGRRCIQMSPEEGGGGDLGRDTNVLDHKLNRNDPA